MKKNRSIIISVFIIWSMCFGGCSKQNAATDYSNTENWAYFESDTADKVADVFFACPTVYFGSDDSYNMELTDEDTRADFFGAINMEKGIYDADSRFFALYYRQAGFNVYSMEKTRAVS